MPYVRSENSFADATTKAMHAVGGEALAGVCGVSYSRLRQCSNPMRGDVINMQAALDADIASARVGAGCPHFESYAAQLHRAGVIGGFDAERAGLRALIRSIAALLREAADRMSAALEPQPRLCGVAA
ncbi:MULTISPECIES: hypothetical protein [Thalassospira]|uniref:hypothetical protein n=1 Tax=Thalassospira TaxID=168934 RepID=UPI00080FF58F|nr:MULTISPECIES: hypothetical protein [Thalassospira]OCK08637.1 hypothetical protein KO164_2816 [Thalassospira sp. KO164]SEE53872.1 hypothetical protein SAMN04515623_2845 [Thalassospira permensis]